jgi:hypothetical protein
MERGASSTTRRRRVLLAFLLFAVVAPLGFTVARTATKPPKTAAPGGTSFEPPLIITRGGTYTGNWQSKDADVPAVRVATKEPVTIVRSILEGRSELLVSGVPGADVTIRDSKGRALYPGGSGRSPGRFVSAESVANLVVANNELEGTAGIYVLGWEGDAAAGQSLKIVGNRVRNIDGRRTDGAGGFSQTSFDLDQFLQLDKVSGVPGMKIAWNEVINKPGESRVEDNINIYLSGGTPASPLLIHDNYIQGAYPTRPARDSYSGGGILLGDGRPKSSRERSSAWVHAYNNQVIGTTNHGIAIAAGHDIAFHDNRVVSSGRLPDGELLAGQNVGLYIWNLYRLSDFTNNVATDNVVGWYQPADRHRNDWWLPDCSRCGNNRPLKGGSAITLEDEASELTAWRYKVADAGVPIGPSW